jgi:arylsulfatase A-like enzyme
MRCPGLASNAPLSVRSTLAFSAWFGLSAGLFELAVTLIAKWLRDPSPVFFRMNRHVVWSVPLANLSLFILVGLALALFVWFRRGRALRSPLGALSVIWILTILLSFRRIHPLACVVLACALACRFTIAIETNRARLGRIVRWSLPAFFIIMVGLIGTSLAREMLREHVAFASLPEAATSGPGATNVLLIVLDTVRADRLSLYGYGRDTTPNLARLAQRGVTFKMARSTASWTLPSHASMMTGRWPHETSARLHGPLDATHTTLAAFLAGHGYSTAGFVANTTYCGAETGLNSGFVHYEDHDLSPQGILRTSALGQDILWQSLVTFSGWVGGQLQFEPRKDAARISRDFLAWTDSQGKRPFFAFLNFFDSHTPYRLPAGAESRFGIKPENSADFATLDRWFTLDKRNRPPRDLQLASDAYDNCLSYLDAQLGSLFDRLERRGLLKNTLVIITADHGESFGEHELFCHASSLYDPEIHVPLIAILPGNSHAGEIVESPVSLHDLPATITDLIGLYASSPFPGQSLARRWDTTAAAHPEPTLAEIDGPAKTAPNIGRSPAFRGPLKAIVIDHNIYIRNGDGAEELYDVAADPAQKFNLRDAPSALLTLKTLRLTMDKMTDDDCRPIQWRNTVPGHCTPPILIEPPNRPR